MNTKEAQEIAKLINTVQELKDRDLPAFTRRSIAAALRRTATSLTHDLTD